MQYFHKVFIYSLYPLLFFILTFALSGNVAAQNAPSIDPIDDVNLAESSSPTEQTVNLTGITDNDGGIQEIAINATSDNTSLIPDPQVHYVSPETTGTLTFTPVADKYGTATITVTVTDPNGTYTEKFAVNVNGKPAFTSASSTSFDENATGTVIDVNAQDPEENTITFSLTAGTDDNGLFDIGPASGALTFKAPPDYEAPADENTDNIYVVTVTATDNGTPNASNNQTISITVINVNEAPVITSSNNATVHENQTSVLTVTATDPENNPMSYSLPAGTGDNELFSINPTSGVLTFKTAPDYEAPADEDHNNIYIVTVTASDNQTPALSSNQTITVTVDNVNEAPVFTSPNAVSVDENQTAALTVAASDPENNPVSYSLPAGTGDNDLFTINPTSGVLTFKTAPNFEAPTDGDANNIYLVTVMAADNQTPSLSSNQNISITVNNVNEAPVFTSPAAVSVDENQTATLTVAASDPENDPVTYSLPAGTGDNDLLTINSTTGVLTFKTAPDFEAPADVDANNIYQVTVVASDNQNPIMSNSQNISITVNNVNEPPVFTSPAAVAVDENQTATLTVTASDPENNTVSYSLPAGTGDNDLFTINPTSGVLTFKTAPNFEAPTDGDANNVYLVTVMAADNQTPSLSSNQNISITVNNVNEPPVFTSPSSVTVDENQTTALTVTASDPETNPVTYSLPAGTDDNDLFTINATTGVLTFKTAPDFEDPSDADANNIYQVTVVASDNQNPVMSNNQNISITVNNVNEPPVFTSPAAVAVDENQTATLTVAASDPENNPVSYSLPAGTGDNDLFTINPTSGVLTFKTAPDFEAPTDGDANNIYQVTVMASDNQTPSLSSNQNISITVNNVNEPPVFTSPSSVTVNENQTTALTVTATDPETNPVTYSLPAGTGDNNLFAINATTGVLTFKTAPDFEDPADSDANNIYLVTVVAADNQTPSLSVNQNITITVNNINEAPVIISPNAITVNENQTATLTVSATDPENNPVTYTLPSGSDDNNLFTINGTTGVLTFKTAPDFEAPADGDANNIYVVNVVASDNQTPALSTHQTISITVANVNEAPVFSSPSAIAVDENQTSVLTVTAADPEANPVTYSLPAGTGDNNLFAINATTGVLTFKSAPDFEAPADGDANNIYLVTVKAADNQSPSLSNNQIISVTVEDVNEAPVFTSPDSVVVDENQTAVLTAKASDPENNPVSYLLLSNTTDNVFFSINSDTGVLTFKNPPDYEKPADGNSDNIYVVTIAAADNQSPPLTTTQTIYVTVDNVNEPPVFTSDSTITVAENQTAALTVTATDPENNTVTFSLPPVTDDNDLFSIDANTGVITFKSAPDYEKPADANADNKYIIKVLASDNEPTPLSTSQTVTITVSDINESPVPTNDTYNVNEDDTLIVSAPGVIKNDHDEENNHLTTRINVNVVHGNLVFNPDGSFRYIPEANYNGTDQFSYYLNDGNSDSENPGLVTITVIPQNDPPVAYPNSYSVLEDETLTISAPGVLDNDIDIDKNSLTATLISTTKNGTLNLHTDGSFSYQPDHNYAGTDTFRYAASDGNLLSNTVIVTIDVGATNDPPVSVDDNYTVNEDNTLTVDLPGILDNDYDPDNNSLSTILMSNVSHGNLTFNTNGSFTYTPDDNYNGDDSFTYQVSDGQERSNTSTVTINIKAVNDPPVAANDYFYTAEDIPDNISVLSNDTDPNDKLGGIDPNSIRIVSPPKHGTALIAGTKISYTPYSRFYGNDTLTYLVFDTGYPLPAASDTAFVFIQVIRRHPLAINDTVTTNEDIPVDINVLQNDLDVDIDPSTVTIGTPPSHGVASVNPTTGVITYTPDLNYNGLIEDGKGDGFTYTVYDKTGLSSDLANVFISITPVPDPPVTTDISRSTPEDVALTIQLDVFASDPDDDLDPASIEFITNPSHGTVSSDNLTGSITYQPNIGFSGGDTLTFRISDLTGNKSNISSIFINVSDEAPSAINDTVSIFEDQIIKINVLANDSDPQNNIVPDSVRIVFAPSHGTANVDHLTGIITYTPDTNYYYNDQENNADIFTYSIADATNYHDQAQVVIKEITPVNDPPSVVNDYITTQEDQSVKIDIISNDFDIDNPIDSASVNIFRSPEHGQVSFDPVTHLITYTPEINYFGTDSLIYEISDVSGATSQGSVFITIQPVPDPPSPQDDMVEATEETEVIFNVLLNDVDVENDIDSCSLEIITPPEHGTATVLPYPDCGKISYLPDENYVGTDKFTYQINDTTNLTGQAVVNITVINTPDAPVANDDNYTIAEDSTIVMNVLLNDVDADNNIDSSKVSILSFPVNGSVEISENRIIYVPSSNYNGTDNFKYQVCDSTNLCDSAYVYINITPVNDPPVAFDDYDKTTNQPVRTNVAANDIDVDGNIDLYSIIVVVQPVHGSIQVENGTGYIIYTPDEGNYYGPDNYKYRICDTHGACDTATVFLEITSGNIAPVTKPDFAVTQEDTPISISPAANDTDPNDNLDLGSLSVVEGPARGTVTVDELLSQIIYSPDHNFNGSDTIIYGICDLGQPVLCSSDTIYITVTPVNDKPEAALIDVETTDDTPIDINALAYCSDPENDVMSISLSENTPDIEGTVSVNTDGTIKYEPVSGIYCTSEQIIYKVCDPSGLCDTASIFVHLLPTDSDGDNIPDFIEKDGDPDHDGIPNKDDTDSDNDGIPDIIEGAISDPCIDIVADTDGDFIPDYLDSDSDNDGVSDKDEGDGDCDNDGIPNYIDMEDDCVERLDVPATFSPNGDGINDYFRIPGATQLPNDHLYIYNRWGGLVYESDNYDNTWDGKSNSNVLGSSDLEEGTYFYIYKPDETMKVYKGTVYLKR